MTKTTRLFATALGICSLAGLAFPILWPSKAADDHAEERQPIVEVISLKKASLDKTAHLPGDLLPYEAVDIYAKVSGFIEILHADRGSEVKEKAVLAQLLAPELNNNIESARAQYLTAEDQYQRNKKLGPGAIIAAQTIEMLKQNAASAHENMVALQEQKNYLTVVAPFDGVITVRNLHTGAFVIAGGNNGAVPIFRLEKIRMLRLTVPVPEAYVDGVKEGNEVSFTVPAFPNRVFTAKISRIAHSLDLRTRTEMIEFDVDNSDRALAPGMYADIAWPVTRQTLGFVVPTKAVVTTTEQTFIIRISEDGTTEWVDVKRGAAAKGVVEIFGPLHEGERIAARATDEMKSGKTVSVQTADR
jgi:membrane fusion protein (multidrug efflux system)